MPGLIVAVLLAAQPVPLNADARIVFASVEEGAKTLGKSDEFIQAQSLLDRQIRLRSAAEPAPEDVLKAAQKAVRPWTEAEAARLSKILQGLRAPLNEFELPWPEQILFIKTSGAEEDGAAYTRQNAVVLPERMLRSPDEALRRLVVHELFHVASRQDAEFRDRLYGLIGFVRLANLDLPKNVAARRLTNPDAPRIEHGIRLGERMYVPVLLSAAAKFNPRNPGGLFRYLRFRLYEVEQRDGVWRGVEREGAPSLLAPNLKSPEANLWTKSFFDQVGRNTRYIIHPEEILADNFVELIEGRPDAPSPDLLKRLKTALTPAP